MNPASFWNPFAPGLPWKVGKSWRNVAPKGQRYGHTSRRLSLIRSWASTQSRRGGSANAEPQFLVLPRKDGRSEFESRRPDQANPSERQNTEICPSKLWSASRGFSDQRPCCFSKANASALPPPFPSCALRIDSCALAEPRVHGSRSRPLAECRSSSPDAHNPGSRVGRGILWATPSRRRQRCRSGDALLRNSNRPLAGRVAAPWERRRAASPETSLVAGAAWRTSPARCLARDRNYSLPRRRDSAPCRRLRFWWRRACMAGERRPARPRVS